MIEEKAKKSSKTVLLENREQIAKALELLFAVGYVDRKRLYLENFIRGIVFGAGGVIGATVLVATLVWVLSLFGTIPFVGPLFDNTKETIQQKQNSN